MQASEARGGLVTPRIAGSTLMVVGAAAGVFAAFFISHPVWGIPAAILLAFASVGVLAGLLMTARKSWADKSWPPGMRSRTVDVKLVRRQMLVSGAFLLVFGAAAAAGFLFADPGESGHSVELVRGWLLIAVFAVGGAVLIVLGLRPVRPAVVSAERPEDDPSTELDGWRRLGPDGSAIGPQSVATSVWAGQTVQAPIFLIAFLPLTLHLDPWILAVVVAAVVVVIVVAVVVVRRQSRSTQIKADGSALRRGARVVPASELTAASIFVHPWLPDATERSLMIIFTGPRGFRGTVALRRRGRLVLTNSETELLVDLVAASSVELPRDKEDPTGKFSRTLYPTHLTKAEAEALVANPPADQEPLPTARG